MSEIIIDGVNVAECKCFIENTAPNVDGDEFLEVCENVYTESSYCENNKDCTYKQLKRLQADNKRLQMLSCANCGEQYLSPDGAELYEKNVQLQSENEELKKLKCKFKEYCTCDTERLQAENERLKDDKNRYEFYIKQERDNNYKYKQALEEIRKNSVEMLATIEEEGKPNKSIVDTIWCKNIPCCTLYELIENAKYRPFEEAIAEFINAIWQDLSEEEKEQIRGILNG